MFSLRVLLSFWLIFCQFQPDIAFKSVAYNKKRVINPGDLYRLYEKAW